MVAGMAERMRTYSEQEADELLQRAAKLQEARSVRSDTGSQEVCFDALG
jgi:hypothetical protein